MYNIIRSSRHSFPILSLLIVGVLFLLAACGGSSTANTPAPTATSAPTTPPTATTAPVTPTPSGPTQTVTITTDSSGSFTFSPATLTISVGTTVIWKNMTGAPHTVTSDDGTSFDSGTANPIAAQSGTYQFTFTKAGTFSYHCAIHPFMKAKIIVQ